MALAFSTCKLILLVVTFSSLHGASPSTDHLSFPLTHRDAESSPLRSVEADPADLPAVMPLRAFVAAGRALKARLSMIKRKHKTKHANRPELRSGLSYEGQIVGDFYLTAAVGTPPQTVIFLVDTGSEFSWTQCTPCLNCTKLAARVPRFAYQKSSSFRAVGCESPLCLSSVGMRSIPGCNLTTGATGWPASSCIFLASYGDGSVEAGFMAVDSILLAPEFAKAFVFGCASIVQEVVPLPNTGLLGFDAGPFSFPSQLFYSSPTMPRKFAHCLPDRLSGVNALGRMEFGNYKPPRGMRYTPLVAPYAPLGSIFYYVKLQGITVGRRHISVVEGNMAVGAGGTIFDSGTALTQLVKPLYEKVVAELTRQTARLGPFNGYKYSSDLDSDLCYKVSVKATELPRVPTVSLHFAGGVDLELGPGSLLVASLLKGDHQSIYFCLALRTHAQISMNIVGNHQQQNYWVEYNLDKSSLGLAPANCAHLK